MTPSKTILGFTAAITATLALGAASASSAPGVQGVPDPALGAVYTTPDNVSAIVARTQSAGWPHRLNATELRGLGRMFSKAVFPLERRPYTACQYRGPRVFCMIVGADLGAYLRVNTIWEDGTARARVIALVA